jgi:hypothetical protein
MHAMIDRSQRPLILVYSPLASDCWGDLESLDAYIASGQARRHWDAIVEEHRNRLAQWVAQGGHGTGSSVWLDGLLEQGEV